ncbi:MAG: hypothetical protein A2719_01325 [Candidatus Ryanbacteria bacterium RIFCSPHIGHO2_01_FULL_45_22]|uniref:HTH arsR-type domain-containing protein n=2 Tax=Candidatus Ryaniibacteriota TaxID=1817914 RepID=A0A1G2G055_9BACT|nr:MAG: hypothetical protein A2719_01325 [Candidatus Ryanbacteria bacterium RIFCSPHIGHO2_01_FULL_45_22]OGZ46366.1 MAG: hypothetical protein A3J54_04210 [Candidatus Ryanbacteria bacterium RIFCSPHIGHO2_02_FULL_45_13b]
MTQQNHKTCAGCFQTLADETRMRIIKFLKEHGARNVGAITQLLRVSQPTVSHHLRVLSQKGFLARDQKGKKVFYSFRKDYPCRGCGVFNAPIRS